MATPTIPPKPDVVLLVDSTYSMNPAIGNVQANLSTILTTVQTAQPDALFAVADYKDMGDSQPFTVDSNLTARACLHKLSVVVGDCWAHVSNPGVDRRAVGTDLAADAVFGWQAGQAFS